MNILPVDAPGPIKIDEDAIYPVKSDKFKTIADLEKFVRSTYIKRTADKLLSNPNGWGPMYVEKDGRLCADLSKLGGVGYYKEWKDFAVMLSDTTETSATLTVTVKEDGPGDEVPRNVDVVFKMIKQGEVWLLADMKY